MSFKLKLFAPYLLLFRCSTCTQYLVSHVSMMWLQEKKRLTLRNTLNYYIIRNLWSVAWCPLLQGTSRLCCDRRSHIRTSALTTLQRALLFHDLQSMLTAREWEASFTRVLFPMLSHLLIPSQPGEREIQLFIVSKIFRSMQTQVG